MHPARRRLIAGHQNQLVDVDVRRPGDHELDALGHVVGRQRSHPRVHLRGAILVAAESHHAELGLDHAGIDLAHPHWSPEQLIAQHLAGRPHRVLGRVVPCATLVGLQAGDRADHDHHTVAARFEGGQERPCHAHGPEDVGLVHPAPPAQVCVLEAVHPEGAAGVVDEDPTLGDLRHEGADRHVVGHVERQRPRAPRRGHIAEPLNPAGSDDDLEAGRRQPRRGGSTDP